jgi:hypothetical protein
MYKRLLRWRRRNRLTEVQVEQMSRAIAVAEMEMERIREEYRQRLTAIRLIKERQIQDLTLQVSQLMDPIVRAQMVQPGPSVYLCADCPHLKAAVK